MNAVKEKLSHAHAAILLYMVQTGIVIFSLPQIEAYYFGTNGWLAVPIAAAIATANIIFIGLVHRLGQGKSVFELMEQAIPKWLLSPLYAGLIGVWSMLGCLVAKEYILIFQMIAFPTTNPMLFKLIVDLLILYLVTKGIYSIGKAASAFFWLIIWMTLLLLFFIGDFDWKRMTGFVLQGGVDMQQGILTVMLAFLGYELSMLLFPYADRKTKIISATVKGNLLLAFGYTLLGIVSFGFYSVDQLKVMLFPVLDLMAFIVFPFVERLENLFYGVFLFSILITSAMFIWAAAEAGKRIVPRAGSTTLASCIVAINYFVSLLPRTLSDIQLWLRIIGRIELGVAFGLPLFILLLLPFREKPQGQGAS